MKSDEVILGILYEVQEEIEKEQNITISIEELFEICNSQFVGGRVAAYKRLSFSLDYIGTFVFKNLDAYVESVKSVNSVKDLVSEEEYKTIIKEKRIANRDTMNGSRLEVISDIKSLPKDVTTPHYHKHLSEMITEIIENET